VVFASAIYYLAFVTATSAAATPEEKKWAMSVLSAGAAGLVGYLVRKLKPGQRPGLIAIT
jgi:hypothetical protein